MIRIVVVDDHALLLSCLENILSAEKNLKIMKTFTKPSQALEFLKTNECDILISDLKMQEFSGLDLVRRIKEELHEEIKTILLSGFYDEEIHRHSLELGVKAFLRKETSYFELVSCITNVYNNNVIIPEKLANSYMQPLLTENEMKVLHLIVDEYTNEEIAKVLYVSKRTVESYINSIYNKLKVSSRIGAVREAIRIGLVQK